MATTTQITNIADKLDLTAYAGDFIDDYDMDAVHADYVSMLNSDLPDGITLAANGDVYATLEQADYAREIDWDDLVNERNVEPIFERHDKTTKLLSAVEDATTTAQTADRQRVAAIRAAKDSGRLTVEEIAQSAGITRDGVYKLLNRAEQHTCVPDGDPAELRSGTRWTCPTDGVTWISVKRMFGRKMVGEWRKARY